MKRRVLLLSLVTMMFATTLVGCSSSEPQAEAPVENAEAPTETTEVSIVDVEGRTVTLPQTATKVVGSHNPTLNIAVILGGGGKYIAGVGGKAPSGLLYSYVFPEMANDVVQVGKGKEINVETCVELGADLAIIPERHDSLIEQFEAVNIPTAVILPSEESFDTIKQSLTLMATLLGEDERATQIIEFMDKQLATAAELTSGITDKKKVLFLGTSSPISVVNGAMLQSSIIEAAGGVNVAKDLEGKGDYIDITVEDIVAMNPQVIYIPSTAEYTIDDIKNDAVWQSIDAVKNNNVYVFPSNLEAWDYPTPSASLGVLWAVSNLYPEVYTTEEVFTVANEYYSLVYGQTFEKDVMGLE